MAGDEQRVRVLVIGGDEDVVLRDSPPTSLRLERTRDDAEGLAALRGRRCDVCLVAGSRGGLGLLAQAVREGGGVPIIYVATRGEPGLEQRVLAAGAADYLVSEELDGPTLERSARQSLDRARALADLQRHERQFRVVFDAARDPMV